MPSISGAGTLSATTTEQLVAVNGYAIILETDADVLISLNDNTKYFTLKAGEVIELEVDVAAIYYKTASGTANVRYWVFSA